MIIDWKKEVYKVRIECGDEYFSKYSMDCKSYARIDNEWFVNTGGSVFEWSKIDKKNAELLENVFIIVIKENKNE